MLVKLTLPGFLTYDPKLFDGLTVPPGVSRETLINRTLVRAGEFPVIYADPDYMREVITSFSNAYQLEMTRTWDALNAEYNPLHNFDRNEEWTESETGESSNTSNSSDSSTGTATTAYKGDNGGEWAEAQQDQSQTSGSGESSVSAQGKTDRTHTARLYGNIGVTTSQQMLTSELDLRLTASWYDLWAAKLVTEICIPIY